MSKGMHCLGCSIAAAETLSQAANVHGLNPEELIEEINQHD
jgi:hybrid cluster-associated redox disulfide protein